MRTFFLFMLDPKRTDLQSVVQDNIEGPRLLAFWQGIPVKDRSIFAGAQMFVSHNKPAADLVGNGPSLLIMSDRLLSIIRRFVPEEDYQQFPAPLFDVETKEPVVGYSVFHGLRKISAAGPGCDPKRLHGLVIQESAIPLRTHYFRLLEQPGYPFVSEELKNALSQENLQGVLTKPYKTVS